MMMKKINNKKITKKYKRPKDIGVLLDNIGTNNTYTYLQIFAQMLQLLDIYLLDSLLSLFALRQRPQSI